MLIKDNDIRSEPPSVKIQECHFCFIRKLRHS
jgi:hypothetical protein